MIGKTNIDRFEHRGAQPVRIGNCSGAAGDPGYQMLRQATDGDVHFITGDYLAEVNLAENAQAMAAGRHEGFAKTAWEGLEQSVDVIAEKHIKVVINGGALNPEGLARKCQTLVSDRRLNLVVAWVSGDDVFHRVKSQIQETASLPRHLDAENEDIVLAKNAQDLLKPGKALVSAHAYLGARAIVKALDAGADIVICGRVADASPVIGAAWWWHRWQDTDYDRLAGALVAGHLIECSAYVTGANFSGFDEIPMSQLIDLPFGIIEIDSDGVSVVTKPERSNGVVNVDTVKCQFLYELQGHAYLNSDVTAYLNGVEIEEVGTNRVQVRGIKGGPPPPTTKLAIFYQGGFESQLLFNAAGYGIEHKFKLWKEQFRFALKKNDLLDKFDVLDFQLVGSPEPNAPNQLRSTVYFRVVAQASEAVILQRLLGGFVEFGMQHFSGMHCSLDFRTAMPRPFLAYYPAVIEQQELQETAHIFTWDGGAEKIVDIDAGHPPNFQKLGKRASYDTETAVSSRGTTSVTTAKPASETPEQTQKLLLGDIALGRSGDKGANVNIGLYVLDPQLWDWFRNYMSMSRMQSLIGDDDFRQGEHFLERVEFPGIYAVHFVIYGLLGRGVSSATNLDILGKGFADYIRSKEIKLPISLLENTRVRKVVQWD